MITGVTRGYEYKMKVVYSHFPIQIKTEGNKVIIAISWVKRKQEKQISREYQGNNKGDQVILTGINKEDVGQTAANIRQATKIKDLIPGCSRTEFISWNNQDGENMDTEAIKASNDQIAMEEKKVSEQNQTPLITIALMKKQRDFNVRKKQKARNHV